LSAYLAIDIGASSGRHIIGSICDGKLELEEIHRFENGFEMKDGHLCWNLDALFEEIVTGIEKCITVNKTPRSIGIDTWGCDFVLLDKSGKMIGDAVAYRDSRTDGMDEVLSRFISEPDLYARTGIQKLVFNTVYQFLALKQQQPEFFGAANSFLMIPEYLSYLLTGRQKHEYTNSTTTALVNAKTKDWDYEIIKKIGLPKSLFSEIAPPGTKLGNLIPEIRHRVGFDCEVILPCTHDTGSAVVSAPIDDKSIYLSSGTWSLMGVELDEPICTEESRLSNLSNEGGYLFRSRYLKNIMGLWIIQSIKKDYNGLYSFDNLCSYAAECSDFPSVVNVNEHRFLAPEKMEEEIKAACRDTGQRVPKSIGEVMYCVYHSLAASYAQTVDEIESIVGKQYEKICIIGGGSKDSYLNKLTAAACGRKITAGPVEGTDIGNILVQMLSAGILKNISEARDLVKNSFKIDEFEKIT